MPASTHNVAFTVYAHDDDALEVAYQARLHDPLWLLARQWQFGELQGEDNGSPVRMLIESEELPLTRFQTGGAAEDYDAASQPLETMVEREPVGGLASRPPLQMAQAGQQFLRMLEVAGAGAYREAYLERYELQPLAPDERALWEADALRLRDLLVGRVPDAAALFEELMATMGWDGTGPLPSLPAISAGDQPKVRTAARAWLQWLRAQGLTASDGSGAWLPERMEYRFDVAARSAEGQEVVLGAPEYHGGRLDWDAFVGRAAPSLGGAPQSVTRMHHLLPAPVSYRGQPHARLWAFEDGRVNLGAVGNGQPDLATLVLVEFALIYGNDWFVAPLEVAVGSLSRIKHFIVRDSFGNTHTIQHYREVDDDGQWRMFALSPETEAAGSPLLRASLLLAPSAHSVLESAALEEVLFLRDEMANMAWAVERVVPGEGGQPVNRYEAYQAARMAESADEGRIEAGVLADLAYRLGTAVPDYWIPLLPEQEVVGGKLNLRLRRGAMPRFGEEGGIEGAIEPRGLLLRPGEPGSPLALYEEEVPREGIRVSRTYQYTRWIGGSSYLWQGLHKRPGRGEVSSGLRFDTVDEV